MPNAEYPLFFTARDAIWSDAKHYMRPAQADARGLVRVRRGLYFPEQLVHPEARPWTKRRAVTQARTVATLLARQARFPVLGDTGRPIIGPPNPPSGEIPAATMESSLIMRGLPTWLSTPDIHFWLGDSRGGQRTTDLPGMELHGTQIQPAKARPLFGERLGEPLEIMGGIPVVSLDEALIDLARYAHPLQSWVAVTFALRASAQYGRTCPPERRREDHVNRQRLIRKLNLVSNSRGVSLGRNILELVDTRTESVAEAALLWLLHTVVSGNEDAFRPQMPIDTRLGRFYADFGFPKRRLAVEFDGVEKFIKDPNRMRQHLNRNHAILNAGWDVLSVSWTDLRNPATFAPKLADLISMRGIATRAPSGPLWREFPEQVLDPLRVT